MPGSIVGCVWQFDGSRPASVTSTNAKTREKRSGRSNNGYASEEVEKRQKVVKNDVLSRKLTLHGRRLVKKPPDQISWDLEQPSKENAIYAKLARLEEERMLKLTFKAPGDGLVSKNVAADAEGVLAISAMQRSTLLVVSEPPPIVESVDESSSIGPSARFRRVHVAAAANDLKTMPYQYDGMKDTNAKGRHTDDESLPLSKHPPASSRMDNYLRAIVAVGLLLRCEDEDFVDCENALIRDARNHMTVTVTVMIGLFTPFYTIDIWTLSLSRAATSPERRGTQRSSSSTCHHTPHRIHISRRFKISPVDKWMICSRKSAPKFARASWAHQIRCPSILRVVQTNNCSTTSYTHPPFASGYPYPFAFTPPPVARQAC
ncbi:hypothetical protein JOM56_014180 [Amanita muscaria]